MSDSPTASGRTAKGQFPPGVSGNPGGRPHGHVNPSVLMRRFGQLPVEELRNLVGLNCAELRARRVVLGGVDIDDDRVGLEYIKTADDRVEGKPHQATEVRLEHVIDPMHVDTTRAEQAMAAAELLRSEGLDVPAALQAIIEEPDSDE